MKDLLLCVHVVIKTLNLEISCCHLADYVKAFCRLRTKARAVLAARLIFLIQRIRSLFPGVSVAFAVAVAVAFA